MGLVIDSLKGVADLRRRVNLTALFVTTKAAIAEFMKRPVGKEGEGHAIDEIVDRGVILNIISVAGMRGYRAGISYSPFPWSNYNLIEISTGAA